MGFRYDMRGKTPQQQAIVRDRDAQEKLLKEKRKNEFPKPDFSNEAFSGFRTKPNGDYQSVTFFKEKTLVLELRISGTAISNGPCGLLNADIHKWLWETGSTFIKEISDKGLALLIYSYDVQDKVLVTDWKNLKKVDLNEVK